MVEKVITVGDVVKHLLHLLPLLAFLTIGFYGFLFVSHNYFTKESGIVSDMPLPTIHL
jgi:hypothetical protein